MLHLVRLHERVLWLKIENLGNCLVREDVMTALDSLREAKTQEKSAQFGEANVRIRGAAQDLQEN